MTRKYIVDRISEDCIRVYPEKQTSHQSQGEVKKRKVTLYDYGEENGFSITPPNLNRVQKGTIFKIKEFPLTALHESTHKFFIRLSFSKATLADAENIIKRDAHQWFKFFKEQLIIEGEEAVEESANKKRKSKKK